MKNKKYNKTKQGVLIGILIWSFVSFSSYAQAGEINSINVIKLVNDSREKGGLEKLQENEVLSKVAQDKLADMIANKYFAHTSPQGVSPWYWFEKNSYDYRYAGENLAINFLTVENQHQAWMNSPTHRKNILNANYQEIGVAVMAGEIDGELALITVQEFGTKIDAPVLVDKEKNFSGQERKNLVQDGKIIEPSVLSFQNVKVEDLIEKKELVPESVSLMDMMKDYLKNNKNQIAYYLDLIAFFLFASSVVLTPMVILSSGTAPLRVRLKDRKNIVVKFKDNINEIKFVKVHFM